MVYIRQSTLVQVRDHVESTARQYDLARRAVELVAEDLRPSTLLTRGSLRNAVVANAAIGGSTNAVVHLAAIFGRLGLPDTEVRCQRPVRLS